MRAQVGLHPQDWPSDFSLAAVDAWGGRIGAALAAEGPGGAVLAGSWRGGCILVLCGFPLNLAGPVAASAAGAGSGACPVMQLVGAALDLRNRRDEAARWVLAADPDHLWLAQADTTEERQATLLAAAGRMML